MAVVLCIHNLMQRTTIMLPADLKVLALHRAREQGLSLGEFLRRSLEASLAGPGETPRKDDPLFSDVSVYDGPVPADLAANHDDYLYGKNGEA